MAYKKYKNIAIMLLLWSALVSLSLYLNIHNFEKHSIRLATHQANDYWNKDSAFRAWATRHGGVYVKPDNRTPPNPLLAHLPHRDVETKSGVKLTLMNPAYMMRQMTQEFQSMYGVRGNITGLKLLDPKGERNKPDAWELDSLKKFKKGTKEVVMVSRINGQSYLRMMRPMFMKEGCVPCHGHLGYKAGDMRGGVSVSIPLKPYEMANASSRNQAVYSHLVVWLIGLAVIWYIDAIKKRHLEKEKAASETIGRVQKMDALGKLTGGIAHDYNNMLGVITGFAELLEEELDDRPKLARFATQILRAGERGAKLTKKLLAFSRKKSSDAKKVQINGLLRDEEDMLRKTLTVRINLKLDMHEDLWPVWIDESDLEDAILNICINAMHAIDGNGEIDIQTRNRVLNGNAAGKLNLGAGEYISLGIADNGCGMSKETLEKIFEPFYSTKGDKGTGLGLSQVYGFVQRSGGAIDVDSSPGKGTRISLIFPRYHETGNREQHPKQVSNQNLTGSGTILVVDDEPDLLDLTCETLKKHQYDVFSTSNAEEALNILERESINLLISDVIMPEMDGFELVSLVKEKYPSVKIQLISGLDDKKNQQLVDDVLLKNLLCKPVNSQDLLSRVHELMNA